MLYNLVGRWSKPSDEELSKMHRSEAQLWLCIRQLLLEPRLSHYYTINECRRNAFCRVSRQKIIAILNISWKAKAFQFIWTDRKSYHYSLIKQCILQLQGKMTEPMLDQIPPLGDLKMFLCRLAVGDYSSLHNRSNGVKNPGCTLIEIVPQVTYTF